MAEGSSNDRSLFATADTVDRIHTEAKTFRAEQMKTNEEHNVRLIKAETFIEGAEKRFNAGARKMAQLEEVQRPSLWKVISVVAGTSLVIGGFIWKLSRYPDHEEFKMVQDSQAAYQRTMDQKIQQFQLDQAEQRGDIREIKGAVQRAEEQQKSIDAKLDQMLNTRTLRRP